MVEAAEEGEEAAAATNDIRARRRERQRRQRKQEAPTPQYLARRRRGLYHDGPVVPRQGVVGVERQPVTVGVGHLHAEQRLAAGSALGPRRQLHACDAAGERRGAAVRLALLGRVAVILFLFCAQDRCRREGAGVCG